MQYQATRLEYQFNKLRCIREGIHLQHGGNVEFELFSFFEICYHLKDWIKNSLEYSSFSNVEHFVDNSPPLRICADICNKLKHRKTTRKRRSKSELGIFYFKTTTTIYPYPHEALGSLDKATIITERGEECCFSLAEECIAEWNRYFDENGIQCSLVYDCSRNFQNRSQKSNEI